MAKINNLQDFIKEAITIGYGAQETWTLDKWNEQIKERYDTNRQIYNLRVTDITEKSILGASENSYGTIKLMNRLDNIIENETDPVKKATAMAVRHIGFPECNTIIENNILETIKSFRDEIINNPENKVSKKAIAEFDERVKQSNKAVSGMRNVGKTVDPNSINYDQLSANEQLVLVQTLINSFMDSTICRNRDGSVLRENQAMRQLLAKVNDCAKDLVGKVSGERGANFKPADDREKADLEALSNQVKAMNDNKKAAFANRVNNFNTLEQFAKIDITPRFDKAVLKLDKSPIFSTTAEAYVDKQKKGTLSNVELEWGESNIDYMVESLYTANELRTLKLAGIDPAMGILVDGKPLDWNSANTPTFLTSAKNKCEIVSKAMQGSKIDVSKFVPDGWGGYKSGKVVPVKTDLSMKTERRSIWTAIKQFFGFSVSLKDKVKKANDQVRNYENNLEDAKIASAARRNADIVQIREKENKSDAYNKKMDIDFFGEIYPATGSNEEKEKAIFKGITKDSHFTNSTGGISPIIGTLGRGPSRVNLAILYGMTQGHTIDEMMADTPEGKNLRKQVGKDFVGEFRVCTLDEFAKEHEIDAGSLETKNRYNQFVLDKIQNVEKMCARSCEEFVKLPLIKPEVNDRAQFLLDYDKLNRITVMSKDISQAYETLTVNKLAPTNEAAIKVHERTSAVFDYISSQVEPIMKFGFPLTFYSSYINSDSYAQAENLSDLAVDRAAKSKAFFAYFNKKTIGMNTIADLNNDKNLCTEIYALASAAQVPTPGADKIIFDKEAKYYLPNLNHNVTTVLIDDEMKHINAFGNIFSYSDMYRDVKIVADNFTKGIEAYDKLLDENQRNLPLSEKIDAIKAAGISLRPAEKQAAAKEKISLSELAGEKTAVTTKPKEAAAKEKALDMGGAGK